MKRYILTIDEGTTSLRVILYDLVKHKIKKFSRAYIDLISPHDQWVEQDANDIYAKTLACLKDVTQKVNLTEVYGLGITNQRETVVAWDRKTGEALANAIVWKCRRTSAYCKKLAKTKWAKVIKQKTGLIINSYFSASKIRWLLDNNKKVAQAAKQNNICFGTIESYLVYRLTRGTKFVTDVTNASRTMLFNINTLKWDDQLLKLFGVKKQWLPTVVDNDSIVGYTDVLGSSITIAGLIGDQQSSLLGQGCISKGQIKNTYGTGCFMLANIGNKPILSKHGLLTTIASRLQHKTSYALEGSVFSGGSIMNWMISNHIAMTHRKLVKMASKEKSNDVILIPAFHGIGAPYWKMDATEKFVGKTSSTTNSQIAKAGFNALLYRTYDVFSAMRKDFDSNINGLCVDGGQSKNKYLMSRQADILQTPLYIINLESTCMGAIICTALATKAIKDLNEIKKYLKPIKTFYPKHSSSQVQPELTRWLNEIKKFVGE